MSLRRMRPRQQLLLGALIFLGLCYLSITRLSTPTISICVGPSFPSLSDSRSNPDPEQQPLAVAADAPPPSDTHPRPAPPGIHPIKLLIDATEANLTAMVARQSKTLSEAVAEYERRYGMPPPPHFDKWFEFAQARDVVLIDEFDSINDMLLPFWGLRPETLRARAKEALGWGDNVMLGVLIRTGKVTYTNGGRVWMRDAIQGMLEGFLEWLPNVDLAFNVHDEPRIVVPHDDLARLVERGRRVKGQLARNAAGATGPGENGVGLKNAWTKPKGLNEGSRFEPAEGTRFNSMPYQQAWHASRLSCPPDSAARALDDEGEDQKGAFALSDIEFVYNTTAHSDVCLAPSVGSSHGLFVSANAFNLAHDLMPIFSQSKLSNFQDILFPSPWYWYDKVPYNEERDPDWELKESRLYWRGSTTGEFSRNGLWKQGHRQRLVARLNDGAARAKILANRGSQEDGVANYEIEDVSIADYAALFDIAFSEIGQCDSSDCSAMRSFFNLKHYSDQQVAWKNKYLLDMDGNAFSGRFYAFLRSKSLVFKMGIFREWHAEWLRPWLHYVPLSLRGEDWVEAVRFFGAGQLGKEEGRKIAGAGREWAAKTLRNEDLEVWFFRLLLEYGRVVDDERERLGFTL